MVSSCGSFISAISCLCNSTQLQILSQTRIRNIDNLFRSSIESWKAWKFMRQNKYYRTIKVYHMYWRFSSLFLAKNGGCRVRQKMSDIKQVLTTDKFFHYEWDGIRKQKMSVIKQALTTDKYFISGTSHRIFILRRILFRLWMLGYLNLCFRVTSP